MIIEVKNRNDYLLFAKLETSGITTIIQDLLESYIYLSEKKESTESPRRRRRRIHVIILSVRILYYNIMMRWRTRNRDGGSVL